MGQHHGGANASPPADPKDGEPSTPVDQTHAAGGGANVFLSLCALDTCDLFVKRSLLPDVSTRESSEAENAGDPEQRKDLNKDDIVKRLEKFTRTPRSEREEK